MPATPTPLRAASVLVRQLGVATRGQLLEAGWGCDELRGQLDARRWRKLNDAVVCTHNGPLTPGQARWAVLLSAQQPAALCGLTAMDLYGVTGFETATVHVVVRRGARVLPVPGVDVHVHESRRFDDADCWEFRAMSLTTLSRSVVDAAVWSRDSRTAGRIVVAAVQQRKAWADALIEELESAGQVRHRRLLLSLLHDLAGGAQALSEVAFLAFCRRHGFPKPTLQHRLDAGGRRRYLDAVFRRRDGGLVRVEIDGGVHLSLTARWRDTAKDNDAALAGKLVLRFPSVAIYTDDPLAVAQLRRALGPVSS